MYVITVPDRYRQTDGQTDRQTDRQTKAISIPRYALVHRAVKTQTLLGYFDLLWICCRLVQMICCTAAWHSPHPFAMSTYHWITC